MEGTTDTDLVAMATQAAMDFETKRAEEAGVDTDDEEE